MTAIPVRPVLADSGPIGGPPPGAPAAPRISNTGAYGRAARQHFVTEQRALPAAEDSYLDRWQNLDETVKQKWREQSDDLRVDGNTLVDLLKQQNAA